MTPQGKSSQVKSKAMNPVVMSAKLGCVRTDLWTRYFGERLSELTRKGRSSVVAVAEARRPHKP
jgi:hypothetical protein